MYLAGLDAWHRLTLRLQGNQHIGIELHETQREVRLVDVSILGVAGVWGCCTASHGPLLRALGVCMPSMSLAMPDYFSIGHSPCFDFMPIENLAGNLKGLCCFAETQRGTCLL